MHELGVVFQAIKIVEEVAKENNLIEIESVTVEIGEVSTVIESYLQDCGNKYETVTYGKTCPKCNSTHTYLLQGNEFNIKEIEGC